MPGTDIGGRILLNVSVALNMDSFAETYGISSGPEWTIKLTKVKN